MYRRPLLELIREAAIVHGRHHDPSRVQCAALASIKTGGCSEDCAYCPQSAHHETSVEREPLWTVERVTASARAALRNGADRFCMGVAAREVRDGPEFDRVLDMIAAVRGLGLETCVTLGMLKEHHADRLREAGLDYYNHNLDTSPEYYGKIITTRKYDDRLATLRHVRNAGIKVCCGGIVGMGESDEDRIGLIHELARLDPPPESVPVNTLVAVPGTPLGDAKAVEWDLVVRVIATLRLLVPRARIRLSAGRGQMTEAVQALCFLAGANSLFLGECLLTTPNPEPDADRALLRKLGLGTLSEEPPPHEDRR